MPSLQNHAFVALLRLTQRKRICASAEGLMRGIAREAGRLYAGALPTTILAGTRDLSHHDAVDLALKARSQGSPVDLRLGQDMIHVWPLLPIPEGRQARVEIAALIRARPHLTR